MQKLFIILVLLFFTGCSYSTSVRVAKDFHPLWKYDTLPNGFKTINQYYYCKFKDGQNTVKVEISPSKYKVINSTSGNSQKRVHYKGIDYIVYEVETCWDGQDDNGDWTGGSIYQKDITWMKGNFVFSIGAETNTGKEGLNFITTKLASTINIASIKKMKKDEEGVRAEYKNEDSVNLSIDIKDVEYGNKRIEELKKEVNIHKKEEMGLTCYTYKHPSGYMNSIYCMTKNNFYEFLTGVPYRLQTEELRDVVDFLNWKYAYQIIEEIE